MKLNLQKKARFQSQNLLLAYFSGAIDPFSAISSPDFNFIGPDATASRTIPPDLVGTLSHSFFEIQAASQNHCIITGTFHVVHNTHSPKATACRATLVWAFSYATLTLCHCHVSCALTLLAENEKFPIHVGMESFALYQRYYQRIQKSRLLGKRCVLTDNHRQTHFLYYTDMITFKSLGQQTICHCHEKSITLNTLLSTIASRLPDAFVRIQRSLIINTLYLTDLSDKTVTLTDGTVYTISPKYNTTILEKLRKQAATDDT